MSVMLTTELRRGLGEPPRRAARRRACAYVLSACTLVCGWLLAASGAAAKSCPNASTSTVSASPSYTYTRGCIVSFDGTAIVYNLFEPLHPAAHSLHTILGGPGWG